VLLDVLMPEMDGFEVVRALREDYRPAIVFVTAHDRFAVRAFEVEAIDYLLKPFDRDRLQAVLRRAREVARQNREPRAAAEVFRALTALQAGSKPVDRIAITSGTRVIFWKVIEIEWIRSADNYTELHLGDTVHLLRKTISTLEQELPSGQFLRIGRSLMVNLECVREIRPKSHGDYVVVLQNGEELTGSRNYRDELQKLLGKVD
jgi:two-component system, LytTR family, response regulator